MLLAIIETFLKRDTEIFCDGGRVTHSLPSEHPNRNPTTYPQTSRMLRAVAMLTGRITGEKSPAMCQRSKMARCFPEVPTAAEMADNEANKALLRT